MTLRRSSKTIVGFAIAVSAVGFVGLARAESGDGASVIPPDAVAVEAASPVAEPDETASLPKAMVEPEKTARKSRIPDIARASMIRPLIIRYAQEHRLPVELADAVVRIESRYNAAARNGPNLGLTQVNFRTAQSLGYTGEASGLFDAETNLRYGLKYLAQAYKLAGGDLCGAILRYQGGHRAQTMTNASRVYCAKVRTILTEAR